MSFSRRSLPVINAVAGIAGLAVAVASALTLGIGGAGAATAVDDGSDWGAQGTLSSDSPVTVRWDNDGNALENTVVRDQTALLAHTAGKNYFDIPQATRSAYSSYFGAGNGVGGLSVTVSQTTELLNQGVQVSFTGAKGGDLTGNATTAGTYLQVFQCWGGEGQTDGPDQSSCEVTSSGPDTPSNTLDGANGRYVRDPMVRGGDWGAALTDNDFEAPFTSISGSTSKKTESNTFFNPTTTNQATTFYASKAGSGQRSFEMQTGAESSGLGCGYRGDSPSRADCWLVVVPRLKTSVLSTSNMGPLSPSLWAQRLQVKLSFQDVAASCPSGSAQVLVAGSELVTNAAASWTPGLCDSANIALGYTRIGDEVARNQLRTGGIDAIVATTPLPATTGTIYAPVALDAPVIALNIDYQPCSGPDPDAGAATACGYADLDAAKADAARYGDPVTDVKLNARLVAKLLTQFYQGSLLNCSPVCLPASSPAWEVKRPSSLIFDPEFQALNPQLKSMFIPKAAGESTDLLVEAARSDAASAVWNWILADPAAASFLGGCPDDNDYFVNPFYSSRTYEGCAFRAVPYERQAAADRAATKTPSSYVDEALAYPPDGSPFPQPNWAEVPANELQSARTIADQHPRMDTMALAARSIFKGKVPHNTDWCPTTVDTSCLPAPGKWKDSKGPTTVGERTMLTITDSASAARYQLATAQLCDDGGASCVGANTASLQRAADRLDPTPIEGVLQPAVAPDYAGGAYPITMPVYLAVATADLTTADAAVYADIVAYLSTTGQDPGFGTGDLPPGYAPLTAALASQASASIAVLRGFTPPQPTASPTATPTPTPTKSATTAPTPSSTPTPTPTPTPTATKTPKPTKSPRPSSSPTTPAAVVPVVPVPTSATTTEPVAPATTTVAATAIVPVADGSWPQYALPGGLGVALASGVFAPFLRRRHTLTIRSK